MKINTYYKNSHHGGVWQWLVMYPYPWGAQMHLILSFWSNMEFPIIHQIWPEPVGLTSSFLPRISSLSSVSISQRKNCSSSFMSLFPYQVKERTLAFHSLLRDGWYQCRSCEPLFPCSSQAFKKHSYWWCIDVLRSGSSNCQPSLLMVYKRRQSFLLFGVWWSGFRP